MKLIPNWKRAWRMASVRFAAVIVAWAALPPEMQTVSMIYLGIEPSHVPGLIAIALIVARLIDQPKTR